MEVVDEGLSFDFEGGLEGPSLAAGGSPQGVGMMNYYSNNVPPPPSSSSSSQNQQARNPKSYRQTVCRHWLRGLCMKGDDACEFLHQFDKARMPVCQFFAKFGECQNSDCVFKHTNEAIKECHMYKLGFCPNGPACRYRHQKLPGPPPPVEQHLQKTQRRRVHAPNSEGTTTHYGKHPHAPSVETGSRASAA